MRHSFSSTEHIYRHRTKNRIKLWLTILILALIIILFLPWTQNIRANGSVTTLRQEQRPQQINTIIGGRVEKWFVKEGDFVNKGDTILLLSEIKAEYLDPELIKRTKEQINAKESGIRSYEGKIGTADNQISALQNALNAKLNQLQNKLIQANAKLLSDSMDMIAAQNDFKIASLQFNRQKSMYDSGLVSLTQLEQRNQSYQSNLAKKVSAENKYLASRQEINIIRIEFNALQQDNLEKISKAEGDKFTSMSMVASGEGDIAKLRSLYASYVIRNGMYAVIAPQKGQIVKAITSGIGEVIKEGETIVNIVPNEIQYAVQLYVRPVDLPLISPGQKVRFLFDGFPAIVFSGWPQASYGTFSGIVSAVESDVSVNGKFRVLIKEDDKDRKWPSELKIGTGANGIALLKDVPVWYELWRNINSFPPDYYKTKPAEEKK